MPHYHILSPLQNPTAYAVFVIHWLASLVCIFVAVHFLRKGKGNWWSLVILAFALPLITETIHALSLGLPPLPFSRDYTPPQPPPIPGTTGNLISYSEITIRWDFLSPILAIALAWAYLSDRKAPLS